MKLIPLLKINEMAYIKNNSPYKEIEDTRENIEISLDEFGIRKYTINDDLTVDVDGDVQLSNKKLDKIPFKFGKVTGDFWCDNNELESLEGAPREVGGDFFCGSNKLTSLQGAPREVGNDFYCGSNKLTSLQGAPKKVGGDFICSGNKAEFTVEDVLDVCEVGDDIKV